MSVTVIVIIVVVGLVAGAALLGWWHQRRENSSTPTFRVIDAPDRIGLDKDAPYRRDTGGFRVMAHADSQMGFCFRTGRPKQECTCSQHRR